MNGSYLGMAWLASLGEVKINWGDLTMKFSHKNEEILTRGDLTLTRKVMSLEMLLKDPEIEAITLVSSLGQA